MPTPFGTRLRVALVALALAVAGCASHSDKTRAIRTALDAGQPEEALEHVNDALDVSNAKELPASTKSDTSLLLLDRAMILQELRQYGFSSRDIELADKQIDLLDLSRNAVDDIGKYIFSDDTGPYKAPAYEKLLINTENILNYLARGDLNGARIEARRLAVMQKYLSERNDHSKVLLGPGSYLAGFTFEKSGRADEALRYYDEALSYGAYPSLAEPIRRLLSVGGYSSPRLRSAASAAESAATNEGDAEILIVVGFGRVPEKIARRVPIGLALTYASGALSPNDVARANYLAGQGLVTWVNFPELAPSRISYDRPTVRLDGRPAALETAAAIDEEARRAWDEAKGAVVASAITRMLSRAVTGEVVRQGSQKGVLGALLSLGVQATLTALDTPDTRSWQTLPARLVFSRMRVTPGAHDVDIFVRGMHRKERVTVGAGGFTVITQTVLF
jgi:tetratricopeptide (TPR) repeat protein